MVFGSILLRFLWDFHGFHGFLWFQDAGQPIDFSRPAGFPLFFIAFYNDFYKISMDFMDYGGFGARGSQSTLVAPLVFHGF